VEAFRLLRPLLDGEPSAETQTEASPSSCPRLSNPGGRKPSARSNLESVHDFLARFVGHTLSPALMPVARVPGFREPQTADLLPGRLVSPPPP